ncbi:GroES-like protein [Camillea tinctor]|nr:GroES-like protein [Camillea tinctor]
MHIEQHMQCLVGDGIGQYRLDDNFKIPKCRPGTILCKVRAVALNPVDAKMADYSANPGALGGNDFAGDVVEVGEQVTNGIKVDDRVFAMVFGLNPSDKSSGAFGEYALATADLACKIPDWLSYEEASSMGISIGTAGAALFQMLLQLPLPGLEDRENRMKDQNCHVLVSGGATATGTIAIQLLKWAGFVPIATCSPANADLVRSRGAEKTFDYHSPGCGAEIRSWTNNSLAYVLDCISSASTMTMCYEAIGSSGGRYVALDPFPTAVQYTRRDVKADWLMVYTLFGDPVKLAGAYGRPQIPENREFAASLFSLAQRLIDNRMLKNHPIYNRPGKLQDLVQGIEELRMGRVTAQKLVYTLV